MPSVVPESLGAPSADGLTAALGEALDAFLELTGATAGWVGVIGPDGRLGFPATRGQFAPAWLDLQKGPSVWGFAIREDPALYNELPALPALGEPPLRNAALRSASSRLMVSITTGVETPLARSAFTVSMPLIPGILTSSRMMSALSSRARRTPSSPELTEATTWTPRLCSSCSMPLRTSA